MDHMIDDNAWVQIHRGGETGKLLANNMTGLFVVRIGFAAIMMFPIPGNGFSVGQTAVVKMALWGVGMADDVYATAVKAIGPDALSISQPMIPGTETVVFGLIQNELCRSLLNVASNTVETTGQQLVPEPTPIQIGNLTSPMMAMMYTLSVGDIGFAPACGSITIATPTQNAENLAGVSVDQSALQQQALTTVLNDISGPVQTVAQNFFASRKASALEPLYGIFTGATQAYTAALTNDATRITQQLNASLNANNASGLASQFASLTSQSQQNQAQLSAMGWSGAGAYYLEFAHLNGATLSLLTAVPQVQPPSYAGIGLSLTNDLMPLVQASQSFMTTMQATVDTQDGISQPGGSADLFSGATPSADGGALLEQVVRKIHLSDYALQALEKAIAPTGDSWTDPFGALMSLGHVLIMISLGAMGLAALASSTTGTLATAFVSTITGNLPAAGGSLLLHFAMSFLATPIFFLILSLLIPGLTIAFVLPMIPWVMWMAGVMGWLILVCEAVIAVPLWMLAHMTMGGEGLHGNAREGYALIFNVLFRPVLMLFGLFLGYFVFTSMSWLIRETFGVAAGFVLEQGWLVTNLLGIVILIAIFVMAHVVAALTSFRMISMIPHHVPRLIGFSSANRVDMEQFSRDAALVGVAGSLKTVQNGLRQGMANAAKRPAPVGTSDPPKLAGPVRSLPAPDASSRTPSGGMDSTLHSVSEMGPQGGEGPDDE